MGTFWGIGDQAPQSKDQRQPQTPSQYITEADLNAYVRSNQFRSIMRNQNADLYSFGEWQSFDDFDIYESSFPFTSSSPLNVGSNSLKSGRYARFGNTVIFTFAVRFGTGSSVPTGAICFNLPVQPPVSPVFGEFPSFGAGTSEILPVVLGDVFVYGGQFIDTQAVGWLRAVLRTDVVTGASLSPARFFIAKGFNGEVEEELFSNGILFGTSYYFGDLVFPGDGAIITGRLVYEVEPLT